MTAEVEKEKTKARQNAKRCLDLETELYQSKLSNKTSEVSLRKKGVSQSAQSNRSSLDTKESVCCLTSLGVCGVAVTLFAVLFSSQNWIDTPNSSKTK